MSKPGVEPGPRPSQGRVRIRHTPRTRVDTSVKRRGQESNLRPTLRVGARSQTRLPTVATPDQMYDGHALLPLFAELGEEDSNLYHLIQSQVAYR